MISFKIGELCYAAENVPSPFRVFILVGYCYGTVHDFAQVPKGVC